MLNADLHCHSTASDGMLAPEDVARRAAANGVELWALTDHDTLAGLAAARAEAAAAGMAFVAGVEISIAWQGQQIHVVGLNVDEHDAGLLAGLASIRGGRVDRAQRMSQSLAAVGIDGVFAQALALAEDPNLISRAHFARCLVARGLCADVRSVFERYLVPGRPGYVEHIWPDLADAVGWISAAGGRSVVAHPGRYRLSSGGMRRFLDEFKALGGDGLEVVCGSHAPDVAALFARHARHYGFLASRGSDFHGPTESHVDLGALPPLPDDLTPVWDVF